ncbi:MAG: hypothetical protein Q8S00_32270, partial [Deltaproteobacteria bacterium]|nr:hypothetical protein [Deltaproteobacteria bacterium]
MSFLKSSNSPGYALPANVQKEGISRGTLTTRWAPTGTISTVPNNILPGTGYAVPDSVMREPVGRGTFTTAWKQRGTVSTLPQDTFSQTTLSRGPLGLGSLGDSGADPDPIKAYGLQAANIIARTVNAAPKAKQLDTLKGIINGIDPKLWQLIKSNPTSAQVAAVLSSGIAQEYINLGKGKSKGSQKQLSLSGRSRYREMSGIGDFFKSIGGGIKDAVNKVGSLGCKLSNNPLTAATAAGTSMAMGAPPQTGVVGVQVAQTLCTPAPQPMAPSFIEQSPSWL